MALIGVALGAAAGPAMAQSAAELYYERAVMIAANTHCALFTPDIAAALAASAVQARNTALRAGTSAAALDAALGRAQARAKAAACGGADVRTAADRARQAFKAYASLTAMTFPGDLGDWRAVRGQSVVNSEWRLSQSAHVGLDRMTLGVAAKGPQAYLTAVGAFSDGETPYAARLVLRDPTRAPTPYIANLTGAAPLYARLPPAEAQRVVLAQARLPAELALLPQGASRAIAFRFPAASVQALSALDPREAIGVDFVFAGPAGDEVRRAYFEVGDFAAGLAFLGAGAR
ncbi:MAG TPA: hypothetical protein VMU59_13740 [Caulobacteraceae bacterium]|nr:hypothetical protein [Caulobacteraceae bacterium]